MEQLFETPEIRQHVGHRPLTIPLDARLVNNGTSCWVVDRLSSVASRDRDEQPHEPLSLPGEAWVHLIRRRGPGEQSPDSRPPGGMARGKLDQRTNEIHAEAPCGVWPWFAYGRFRIVDGQLQLAEIRLFPSPERVGLGRQDPAWPPFGEVSAWVAADDFTTPVLRSLPIRLLRLAAIECMEKYGIGPLSDAERRELDVHPGRAGRPDEYYARWAARYSEKTDTRAPIAELAREHGLKREQVRDVIQQARERGLLSPGRRGLLTEKAKTILAREGAAQSEADRSTSRRRANK